MNRSRLARTVVPLTAIVVAAGAGAWVLRPATTPGGGPQGGATGPVRVGGDRVATAAFHTFDDCPALLAYLRTHARPLVTAYGLQGQPAGYGLAVPSAGGDYRAAASDAAGAPADAGASAGTGTNVQVAGVDEADVSKRVGDLVYTVAGAGDGLTLLRTAGGTPEVAGRLATGFHPDALLVDGSTVLLLGSGPWGSVVPPRVAPGGRVPQIAPAPPYTPQTRVAEVDAADPAHPRLVRTLVVDGTSSGARLSGGVLRLALTASPSRLPLVQPSPTGNDSSWSAAEKQAVARNRSVVAASTVDQWLPRYTLTQAGGGTTSGPAVGCSRVGVPQRFSGLGTLTMLAFDLRDGGLSRWDAAGVVASGSTLYATDDHAYVATSDWPVRVGPLPAAADSGVASTDPSVSAQPRTQIHEFATDGGRVRYLGSGEVTGTLLDQYAMDEYQGRLRVATTEDPTGGIMYPMAEPAQATGSADGSAGSSAGASGTATAPTPGPVTTVEPRPQPMPIRPPRVTPSQSAVTVLELRDGSLRQVGRVDGLGRGERIHAVRFAGAIGYVVTFRQTDPLFTLDLADPAHPAVTGELTMPGYSAYLHPLGGGLLLGVGRDASADGMTSGVLMSLFDVADPAHPRLVDRVSVPGAWSGVETDAHAFTYADGMAMVPLTTGVLAVPVRDDGLGTPSILRVAAGATAPDGLDAERVRTFADADRLWTVAPMGSSALLAVHDAHDLAFRTSVRF